VAVTQRSRSRGITRVPRLTEPHCLARPDDSRHTEIMTTLADIEAAAAVLPLEEQKKLFDWLARQIDKKKTSQHEGAHSVLDIPSVSLGLILRPLTENDDLLGEMLEGRF